MKTIETTSVVSRERGRGRRNRHRGHVMLGLNLAMAGRYKFIAGSEDRGESNETDWIENLVTNNGKNQFLTMGSGAQFAMHCVIGTGSTAPAVTDTVLSSYKAGVNNAAGSQGYSNVSSLLTPPFRMVYTQRWRFGVGVAAGNITEVGTVISNSVATAITAASLLFSRALVKDAAGNPTAVTVKSDEYLDVIYELTITFSTSSSGSVPQSIKGVASNPAYLMKPCGVSNTTYWYAGTASGSSSVYEYAPYPNVSSNRSMLFKATAEPDITGILPSGGSEVAANASSAVTVEAYTTNSFYIDYNYTWGLNYGNISGINCFRLSMTLFSVWLYFTDGSSFTKAATDVLTVTVRIGVS